MSCQSTPLVSNNEAYLTNGINKVNMHGLLGLNHNADIKMWLFFLTSGVSSITEHCIGQMLHLELLNIGAPFKFHISVTGDFN